MAIECSLITFNGETTFSHFCIVRLYWTSFTDAFVRMLNNKQQRHCFQCYYTIFYAKLKEFMNRINEKNVDDFKCISRGFFLLLLVLTVKRMVMDNINTINEISTIDFEAIKSMFVSRPHSNCMWFMGLNFLCRLFYCLLLLF